MSFAVTAFSGNMAVGEGDKVVASVFRFARIYSHFFLYSRGETATKRRCGHRKKMLRARKKKKKRGKHDLTRRVEPFLFFWRNVHSGNMVGHGIDLEGKKVK